MKVKKGIFKRIVSAFLVLCMLISIPQFIDQKAFADDEYTKVSDPSTMDDWKSYFGEDVLNTFNAGGVWTDKSVFSTDEQFEKLGISLDDDKGFITALSVIASNKSVEGLSNMPTDTMIVLDLSSSMYPSFNPSTVNTMVSAVNNTIKKLQEMNVNNRVGVSVYFGGEDLWFSSKNSSKVLLPLDRYTHGQNQFLNTVTQNNGSRLVSVDVNLNVKNSANQTVSGSHIVKEVAGTYAQLGILDAMDQFLRDDIEPTVSPNAEYQSGVTRVPVIVLMSDGEPTAATNNYTQREDFKMGNNQTTNRNPAETDFVTQLTAAYAKERIDEKYVETTPLFYTLSLGNTISMDIMDPESNDKWAAGVFANPANYTERQIAQANSNAQIKKYWDTLLTYGSVNIKVQNYNLNSFSQKTEYTYPVGKIILQSGGKSVMFPSRATQRYYVDESFTAENANALTDAFDSIIDKINIQSKYFPTLVEDNENLGGYVTITDNIGKYMKVSDIKGIVIGGVLFSGAELSSNFVAGGGNLGTYDKPSALGKEMVNAVMNRLGIKDIGVAEVLIGQAYNHGQLSYKNANEYSNYIGWYANANSEFLGFWYDGIQTMPDYDDESLSTSERPVYIIKSYGYLGAVDEAHGISKSDMMYATVQVREKIATGEQTVIFSVPAALVPMVNYDISLDKNGEISKFDVSGATSPMRLVYEVVLDERINDLTLTDYSVVDAEYIEANTNDDGSVNFYTNMYEVDNRMGYGTVNAYSHFRPSHENEKYYFQETNKVYYLSGNSYVEYKGVEAPATDKTYYFPMKVYYGGNEMTVKTVYTKLSAEAVGVSERYPDGTWHVPIGTVHVNLEGYTVYKKSNPSGTLQDEEGNGLANVPFVDVEGHKINEVDHSFVVGATLGNNGKITVIPATGLKISKSVSGIDSGNDEFTFTIKGGDENGAYKALKVDEAGNRTETTVSFEKGTANVSIKAGESITVVGLKAGQRYTVSETETVKYVVESVNGNKGQKEAVLATEKGKIVSADFVNAERGTGIITVTKTVEHGLGNDYVVPADKKFDISITLSGVGSQNSTFKVIHSGDSYITSLKTDENGKFPIISLGHEEQIEIMDIPVGVVATVVENNAPKGFTATYRENGKVGDGVVAIEKTPTSVEVVNAYTHEKVYGNSVLVNGTKYLKDESGKDIENWGDAEFTVVLEKFANGKWSEISRRTVNNSNRTFSFGFESEEYSLPGVYAYQIYEVVPSDENRIEGMLYDPVYHTFSVVVSDDDMDGGLEITRVHSEHSGKEFGKDENGNWVVVPNFTNVQHNTTPAVVRIPVRKSLINNSGSALVSLAHHEFALYLDAECTIPAIAENGIEAIEYAATDAAGEAEIDIVFNKTGDYTLYLKEIDKKHPGVIYDDSVVEIKVAVTSLGLGGRLAAETKYNREFENGGLTFNNEYKLEKAIVDLDVRKQLIGREMTDKDVFTFEIRDESGVVLVGQNDKSGKVTFNGSLEFTKVGIYNYTVVETSESGKGIVSDSTVYNVRITVHDNGDGTLVAVVFVAQVVGEVITFINNYRTFNAEYTVKGVKFLEGRPLLNDEFTFVLVETDENGNALEGSTNHVAKNYTNGTFAFKKFVYTKAGTYYYSIREEVTSEAKGIRFDKTKYTICVTVVDDGEGKLIVDSSFFKLNGSENVQVDRIEFHNEYVPAPVYAFIPGSKVLEGKLLGGGEFEFILSSANERFEEVEELERVSNTEDGRITFSDIKYTSVGSYCYIVREAFEQNGKDGIIYDETIYRVVVDITDDHKGFLHSEVHIFNEENVPQASIIFTNKYEVTGEDTVIISGSKVLEGKDLKDGEFTFELKNKESGETFSAVNENGKFEFVLEYTSADVGKTFEYDLYEVKGNMGGVAYDETVYSVVVTVKDNGVGGIEAISEMAKGEEKVDSAVFVNKYEVTGEDTVIISGSKVLEGKNLKDGEFTFVLRNNENGETFSAVNENGKFEFVLEYTSADVGKIFKYDLYEVKGDEIGIEYDATHYEITVFVEDNGEGGFEAEAVIEKFGETADSIEFVNKYTSPADTSVQIEVNKTVENIGSESIGAEGFEFVLENVENGEKTAIRSDENGKAVFELGFTADDVGKTFNYKVSETDEGAENVVYSKVVYNISVAVYVTDGNILKAKVTKDGSEVEKAICDFENVYNYTPPAKPGDSSKTALWSIVLMTSLAGLSMTLIASRRKKEEI